MRDIEEQETRFLGYPLWEWGFALVAGVALFGLLMWQGMVILGWITLADFIIIALFLARDAIVRPPEPLMIPVAAPAPSPPSPASEVIFRAKVS